MTKRFFLFIVCVPGGIAEFDAKSAERNTTVRYHGVQHPVVQPRSDLCIERTAAKAADGTQSRSVA